MSRGRLLVAAGLCLAAAALIRPRARNKAKRMPKPRRKASLVEYLRRRWGERSTWLGLIGIVVSAAGTIALMIPPPWCFVMLAISTLGVVVPDGPALRRDP